MFSLTTRGSGFNVVKIFNMVRPKYYTPNEVAVHNTLEDLWVSFLGKVYNLTPLCEKYKGNFSNAFIIARWLSVSDWGKSAVEGTEAF